MQIDTVQKLELSLAENRPRSLIRMATGSGKTFTAVSFLYRLIKFAGARRMLFLVDRNNLEKQTYKEFEQYRSRYTNYDYAEITKRDKLNLDLFWLKDNTLKESDDLPSPELLAAEIAADLESALERFSSIAAKLGK